MASYLQHTFNFPNSVHFQQLAKSKFPDKAELLHEMSTSDSSLYSTGNTAHSTAICTSDVIMSYFANGEQNQTH